MSAEKANPPCAKCGGPHPFDTVVPSVLWNVTIRQIGLPDYLCATCILRAFAHAHQSFTAELWGADFNGTAIEVRVMSVPAVDAALIGRENTRLRALLNAKETKSGVRLPLGGDVTLCVELAGNWMTLTGETRSFVSAIGDLIHAFKSRVGVEESKAADAGATPSDPGAPESAPNSSSSSLGSHP